MAKISPKTSARLIDALKQFQPIVANAASRDVNESDTSIIVTDLLCYLFGYDKYSEITREYAIRGTYCDLAIKLADKPRVLIEVKAVGVELKAMHTKQAIDYAANLGLEWVILTNAATWKVYKVVFGQPIDATELYTFNISDLSHRNTQDIEKLFLLAKEGFTSSALEDFSTQIAAVNRFTIATLLTNESTLKSLRRDLQRIYPDVKVTTEEISMILLQDILKREVIDSDEAKETAKRIHRTINRIEKKKLPKGSSGTAENEKTIQPLEIVTG